MPNAPRAAHRLDGWRVALAAALLGAPFLTPLDASAQSRERCRYYQNGRWHDCTVQRTTERRTTRHDASDWMVPRRQMSLQVGALRYDLGARETLPMAALRGDWRLSRVVRSELGLAYALGDAPREGGGTPVQASVLATTLGLTAELPTPWVRPYVGAAAGLVGRFDEGGGTRFVRPTVAVPVGVRAHLSPRLALRAESRWRFDQHPSGRSAPNTEFTAGLSVGY
jgi:hypothetical protein